MRIRSDNFGYELAWGVLTKGTCQFGDKREKWTLSRPSALMVFSIHFVNGIHEVGARMGSRYPALEGFNWGCGNGNKSALFADWSVVHL